MPDSLNIQNNSTAFFFDFASQKNDSFPMGLQKSDSIDLSAIKADTVEIIGNKPVFFEGDPHPFTLQSQSWIAILLLFQLFIYTYVFIRFRKFWVENIKELFSVKERSSIFLDTTTKDSKQSFYLSILTGINLGLFLFLFITKDTIYFENKSVTILLFIAAVLVFLLLKMIILNFLGYVFWGRSAVVDSFKSSLFILVSMLGMLLYINVVFLIYGPAEFHTYLFLFGFVSCFLFVFLKAYKLLKYFYIHLYSFIYLILYLCTLEFLPAALLYVILAGIEQII